MNRSFETHLFTANGRQYCLDVNASVLLEISDVLAEVIGLLPRTDDEIHAALDGRFAPEMIDEALETIVSYQQAGFFQRNIKREQIAAAASEETVDLLGASLMISGACNLACRYCFNNGGALSVQQEPFMSWEVARRAVDFLQEHSSGQIGVDFFGGEPLLNWPLIKQTVAYCASTGRDWQYSMITNGTLIDEEIADFLAEHRFHIVISYDGPLQDTLRPGVNGLSNREIVRWNIQRLMEKLPREDVSIRCILTHPTIPYLESLIAEARELGVRLLFGPVTLPAGHALDLREKDLARFQDTIVRHLQRATEDRSYDALTGITSVSNTMLRAMTGKQRYYSCGVGSAILGISQQGDLYPCHRFIGIDAFKMGNIDDGLDMAAYRMYAGLYVDNRPGCSACWARYFCGGGCAHESITYADEIGSVVPSRCAHIRREIELGLQLYVEALETRPEMLDRLKVLLEC